MYNPQFHWQTRPQPESYIGREKKNAANYAFANCRHGFAVANVHLAATTLLPLSVAVIVVVGGGGGGDGGCGGGGGGLFIVVCFYLFCLQLPKSSCAKCIIIISS